MSSRAEQEQEQSREQDQSRSRLSRNMKSWLPWPPCPPYSTTTLELLFIKKHLVGNQAYAHLNIANQVLAVMLNIKQFSFPIMCSKFNIYVLCFAPALMARWRDTALGESKRCEALWVILTCGPPLCHFPFKSDEHLKKKSLSFETNSVTQSQPT